MNNERYLIMLFTIAVLCFTGLVAQCSHRVGECQLESVKAGKTSQESIAICRP